MCRLVPLCLYANIAPGSMLAEALGPAKRQRRVRYVREPSDSAGYCSYAHSSCRVKALYDHQNTTGEQLDFTPVSYNEERPGKLQYCYDFRVI